MKNIELTDEQKIKLKIKDNRIDFYFKVENALVDNYEIFDNIYESFLYVVLCRFCNNNGIAFPSYNTLAKYCHCSRMTVINNIKSLEKKGLINKVLRKTNQNKSADTNIYTINNLKQYKVSGISDILPPVNEVDYPSTSDILNKKQIIKKNNTNNTTTIDNVSSNSIYNFLDNYEFELLNTITKKNIRNNIKNLTEKKFREIYLLTENQFLVGKINDFNAVLYLALNNEWLFKVTSNEKLDLEKKEWLKYFSGIYSDKNLRNEIENIIVDIPLEILKKNKSKLSRLEIFDFKNTLYKLKNQNIQS